MASSIFNNEKQLFTGFLNSRIHRRFDPHEAKAQQRQHGNANQ